MSGSPEPSKTHNAVRIYEGNHNIMRNRFQFARRTAAAVVGVAALAAAGALQASAAPVHAAPAYGHGRAPSISIRADRTTVRAWHKVAFTGTTNGIPGNTKVTVQGLQNGRWVNYPATTRTSRSRYSVSVETGRTGVDRFRVATPKTASDSVRVIVTR
jgi:hypothetical protein